MDPLRLQKINAAYAKLRIAIVGDFCLDRYLEIDPAKKEISIETGRPVHNVVNVRAQPGRAFQQSFLTRSSQIREQQNARAVKFPEQHQRAVIGLGKLIVR